MSTPVIGATCPALYKENYEYHLSGDSAEYCLCILNDQKCAGRVISDPDDQSSQFFSRGKCSIDMEKIKKCPMYGMSKETFQTILKEKAQKELDEKLNHLK
ncbi:MAG: hypothetical protein WC755_09445 [Candidatus Woesearchaeota archaeon]|jgi:hypothetical protein